MTVLSWGAVVAIVVGAFLFGQTARGQLVRDGRHRLGLALSISGPLLALVVGLGVAAATGAWLSVAAGTAAAVMLTAGAGAVLAP